jgi:hypothetical protein
MRVIFVCNASETHLIAQAPRKEKLARVVKLSRNIKDFSKAPLSPSFFDIPYLD